MERCRARYGIIATLIPSGHRWRFEHLLWSVWIHPDELGERVDSTVACLILMFSSSIVGGESGGMARDGGMDGIRLHASDLGREVRAW